MSEDPSRRPDSALVGAIRPSPNHKARIGQDAPDCIVLHYTGMIDGPSALARLTSAEAEVSCHYVVGEDGSILQLVPEARRAWHAGRSSWGGRGDLNSASVGVEIVNGGHDFGLPGFPEPQVVAVIALCRDIADRYAIPPERILAHSDIAPGRKQDPGERFPWERLAGAGLGLWVPPNHDRAPVLGPGDAGDDVRRLKADLARYGYGLVGAAAYDDDTGIVVAAFQRRYRPSRVDGRADAGTLDTLRRLSALRFGTISGDRAIVPEPA